MYRIVDFYYPAGAGYPAGYSAG